jgi:hypothetical protein
MPSRYVWRDGKFRDPATNEPMPMPERDGVCCPRVQSDIKEYASPIDGKMITSRSERRYDLAKHNCVEVDPPKVKRKYRNPSFALKRNLPLAEDVAQTLRDN